MPVAAARAPIRRLLALRVRSGRGTPLPDGRGSDRSLETRAPVLCVPVLQTGGIFARGADSLALYGRHGGRPLHSRGRALHSRGRPLHSRGRPLHSRGRAPHSQGRAPHSRGSAATFTGSGATRGRARARAATLGCGRRARWVSVLQTSEIFARCTDFLAVYVGHGGPTLHWVAPAGHAESLCRRGERYLAALPSRPRRLSSTFMKLMNES